MSKAIDRIKDRYFRQVIAHPDGAVVHHGDCEIYCCGICTCGLLHDLQIVYETELMKELYPKFWEDRNKQFRAIDKLRED